MRNKKKTKQFISQFDFRNLFWAAAQTAQAQWEKNCKKFYTKVELAVLNAHPSAEFATEPFLTKHTFGQRKHRELESIEYSLMFKRALSLGKPKRIYRIYIEQDGTIKLTNDADVLIRRWWYEDKAVLKELVAEIGMPRKKA